MKEAARAGASFLLPDGLNQYLTGWPRTKRVRISSLVSFDQAELERPTRRIKSSEKSVQSRDC
jgi:hypothetical protein